MTTDMLMVVDECIVTCDRVSSKPGEEHRLRIITYTHCTNVRGKISDALTRGRSDHFSNIFPHVSVTVNFDR